MHMFRFLGECCAGHQLRLSADECQHLRVVRVKIGQLIEVGDGQGNVCVCRLQTLAGDHADCQVIERRFVPRPTTSLTTVTGIQMQNSFEQVLRSLTELGSDSLVVFRHRHDAKFKLRSSHRQRWQKIIISAVKQSKRAWLPSLTIVDNWRELLKIIETRDFSCKLLLDREGNHSLNYLLSQDHRRLKDVCLISGSSCGFSADELVDLQAVGAITINLGVNTLRAKTAIIFATGLVNFCRQRELL